MWVAPVPSLSKQMVYKAPGKSWPHCGKPERNIKLFSSLKTIEHRKMVCIYIYTHCYIYIYILLSVHITSLIYDIWYLHSHGTTPKAKIGWSKANPKVRSIIILFLSLMYPSHGDESNWPWHFRHLYYDLSLCTMIYQWSIIIYPAGCFPMFFYDLPPWGVISSMACWKPWIIKISDFPS